MFAARMRCTCNHSSRCCLRSSIAWRCIRAGISSDNNSSSSSDISGAGTRAVRQPGLAAAFGQCPDTQNIGGALGHADGAARIEEVEQVARLQALVIRGQCEAVFENGAAFDLGVSKMPNQPQGVSDLEIVSRELALGPAEHVAIGDLAGSRN